MAACFSTVRFLPNPTNSKVIAAQESLVFKKLSKTSAMPWFMISVIGATHQDIKKMQVLDLNGSIIQSKQGSGLWQKDEFERGVYLLRVVLSSGEVATWKVVV